MKHASNRKPIFVLLTLLLCLCVFGALAFSASAQGELTVNVDFGADHEAYVQSCYGASGSFNAFDDSSSEIELKVINYTTDGAVVSFQVDEGTTVFTAENFFEQSFFTIDGLAENRFDNGQKRTRDIKPYPLSAYMDPDNQPAENNNDPVIDGMTLYVHWLQPAVVNVTVERPVCGTEITSVNNYAAGGGNASPTSSPAPVITVTGDATLFRSPYHEGTDGFWCNNAEGNWQYQFPYNGFFAGTIEGGKSYYATFLLDPKYGYYLEESSITVNGGVPMHFVLKEPLNSEEATITAEIPAVHAGEAPVWTWSNDCSLAAVSMDCPACGTFGTFIATISSQITKEATATEDGEILFTATATVGGFAMTDTRTLALPATGTPEQPTEPDTPEQPTQPDTPEQPTQPDTPEQPTEPGTPGNSSNGSGKKTIDDFFSKLFAWLIELFNMFIRWITNQ